MHPRLSKRLRRSIARHRHGAPHALRVGRVDKQPGNPGLAGRMKRCDSLFEIEHAFFTNCMPCAFRFVRPIFAHKPFRAVGADLVRRKFGDPRVPLVGIDVVHFLMDLERQCVPNSKRQFVVGGGFVGVEEVDEGVLQVGVAFVERFGDVGVELRVSFPKNTYF